MNAPGTLGIPSSPAEKFQVGLERLEQLREFSGSEDEFWQRLLETSTLLAGARLGALYRGENNASVQRLWVWPQESPSEPDLHIFWRVAPDVARAAAQREAALTPLNGAMTTNKGYALGVLWEHCRSDHRLVSVFHLDGATEAQAAAALRHLRLVSNLPRWYYLRQQLSEARLAATHLSYITDLVAQLNAHDRFEPMAMALVNELASRHQCSRVALGWRKGPYIRVQALSHTDRFEKKVELVRWLEQAMEEAMDQNDRVHWPAPDSDSRVTREHGQYAAFAGVASVLSVPLRLEGQVVGVITLERVTGQFSEEEQQLLWLTSDLVVRRLAERYQADRWVGYRLWEGMRRRLAGWLGPEHTWAKLGALSGAVGLAVLCFGGMRYRVEAPFELRTADMVVVTAPFAGYIDEVYVEVGDLVQPRQPLLQLDVRDLLLEEAAALADLDRALREAEKARAREALAEMRLAEAQARQAQARLDLVRHRLSLATLSSPFAGVVVEGDLKERRGAPVRMGDPLFRVARLDRLYFECRVSERDVHELRTGATGQVAFLSQPRLKFPVRVERIEPVAQIHDGANVFQVRCEPLESPPDWWRPGMTGVAKLEVGRRTFLWMVTHRTVDFLRLFFWI
ncbi:MAG: efflux RND transporter periplasmic adaptor subunit [Verrucomicrobiota bacterium]|nr:efflux RND transporter periplasmic adaptor subunit [Limisphaera sp.]MDW8381418.1 efflux RND transporter periplasmic adaptor subunit [Verrucomicrobiota bacterium]